MAPNILRNPLKLPPPSKDKTPTKQIDHVSPIAKSKPSPSLQFRKKIANKCLLMSPHFFLLSIGDFSFAPAMQFERKISIP